MSYSCVRIFGSGRSFTRNRFASSGSSWGMGVRLFCSTINSISWSESWLPLEITTFSWTPIVSSALSAISSTSRFSVEEDSLSNCTSCPFAPVSAEEASIFTFGSFWSIDAIRIAMASNLWLSCCFKSWMYCCDSWVTFSVSSFKSIERWRDSSIHTCFGS